MEHKRSETFIKSLAPLQMEMVENMAIGYRNEKIAEVMNIRIKTVKNTICTIYKKLGPADDEHPRVMAIIAWHIYKRRKLLLDNALKLTGL